LHPLLTDIPIGAWVSASVVDLVGGRAAHTASRRLVGVGIVAAVPTVASGLSDWVDMYGPGRRVGVVHGTANSVALTLQIASWSARHRGHHVRGAALGMLSLGALTVGGYLGGALVYTQRTGVDAEVPLVKSVGWKVAARESELTDGQPFGVEVDGARVVLVRDLGRVYALAATCSHAGGPLDEGTVRGGTIECPWHHSRFCLDDGAVERGPAAAPQFTYGTRVRDGVIEIRRRWPEPPG
jgi:nitrite reductase/ring-hydroxylating ferredoxin subunit